MSSNPLASKFPDMQPIKAPPELFLWNGCGLNIYGSRDYDADTDTCVKTHCVCLLFLPILALGAYRVSSAGQGWYFLGRVPLSRTARLWNYLFVLTLLAVTGSWGWHTYTHTPRYIAGQKLAEADRLAAAGQLGDAARLYQEVAGSNTEHDVQAMARIKELLDQAVNQPPAEAAVVFQVAVEMRQQSPAGDDLFARGMGVVNKHANADPRGALLVLDAVAPAAPDDDKPKIAPRRQQLLERLVAREPGDVDAASELAVLYESQNQLPKCEPLLAPHREKLGTREGARILGQILARQGKYDFALALLTPYVDDRLPQLHAAQQAFTDAQQRIWNDLKEGKAVGFPYQQYQNANQAEQQEMLRTYFANRMRDDPAFRAADEAYRKASGAVQASLDLGIALLRHSQGVADPAARHAELEKAEKTFLAIRGVAGESAQYRLGQVYYWMGKPEQGKKLFDELLKSNNRASDSLMGVASMLHEVGLDAEARGLMEEAYQKATDEAKKYHAASYRSILRVDIDDEILWLSRCDQNDPQIKAQLFTSRGNKALQDGKEQAAIAQLQQAVEQYDKLPVNAATLNNGAIPLFYLFRATGDRAYLDKGVERMDRALALEPSDSILLGNAAHRVMEAALRDIIGNALDLRTLKTEGSLDLFSYLYRDKANRAALVERVRKHPGMAKALGYLDRLLVLAPKRAATYSTLRSVHGFTGDTAALRALLKRLEEASPDLTEETKHTAEYCQGKDDAKNIKSMKTQIERSEAVLSVARPRGNEAELSAAQRATFAVAACTLVHHYGTLQALGQTVDADRLVKLAEEAEAAAPSEGTASTLTAALLLRASQALVKQEPAYAALYAQGKRSLGPTYLLPIALTRDGKLRDAAAANKDVQRAMTLQRDRYARYGDSGSPWAWALLQAAYPEDAAKIAQALPKNENGRLERAIDLRLTPYFAATAYTAYWAQQILGGAEGQGPAVLKRCRDLGVPLPLPDR